ncbi:MAG: AraC family transcriptional regulator [Puia sp.]|nr:AraC family transcriptional regulator [Puia sp.]
MDIEVKNIGGIIYSTYPEESRSGEQFIAEYMVGYTLSGSIIVLDGTDALTFQEGEIALFRKNHLAKFIKRPRKGHRMMSVSVVLDPSTLQDLAKTQLPPPEGSIPAGAVLHVGPDPLLKHYFDSLLILSGQQVAPELVKHKIREVVLLLLRARPELHRVLFDFGMPGKIDLQGFMNRNFRYNVPLEKMAYLTGRSLATFKRDFEQIFHAPPGRWLLEKRLKEAYFLISEKGARPSDVYLDVGFESLSHFSNAFKRSFGMSPSMLTAKISADKA